MFDLLLKLWNFLKWPLAVVFAFILLFWLLVVIYLIIEMKKTGNRPKKASHSHKTVKTNFFKKIFYEFPRMKALDILNRDPDSFTYKGIIIFEGEQGDGKSISMIEFALRMIREFPLVKTIANLRFDYADEQLKDWKQLITFKNGVYGVIAIMDELQNWFSCKDSKDFPPEMLSVVTQNRKNKRIILGTAQSFYMLSKDIRTQCTEVRRCKTLFGCITIVIRKKPICNSAGDVEKWRFLGWYWYVHTPELRECYNTYEVIERFAARGFTPKNERYNTGSNTADLMQRFMEGGE